MVLIGVHSDPNVAERDKVAKEKKLTYPICQDTFAKERGVTGTTYDIDGYPTVFLINKKGIVSAVDPQNLDAAVKAALKQP